MRNVIYYQDQKWKEGWGTCVQFTCLSLSVLFFTCMHILALHVTFTCISMCGRWNEPSSHMEKRVNCILYIPIIAAYTYIIMWLTGKYCKVELMYDLVEDKFCCVSEAVVKLILPYLLQ